MRTSEDTRPEVHVSDFLVDGTAVCAQLVGGDENASRVTSFKQGVLSWLDQQLRAAGAETFATGPCRLVGFWRSAESDAAVPMHVVRAALALQSNLVAYNDKHSEDAAQRIGAQIGVTTGSLPDDPANERDHAMFRLAARLQHVCTPGSVLIAYPTFVHVRGLFWFRTVEPVILKGQLAPIPVYEILGERVSVTHVDANGIEGIETNMIGRQTDLQFLREAYQRVAMQRTPEIITIVGETGLGKSRLNHEFLKYLESLPEIISYDIAYAPPGMEAEPFHLWRELIRRRARIFLNDPSSVAREKLLDMVASEFRGDPMRNPHYAVDLDDGSEVPEAEVGRIATCIGHLIGLCFDDDTLHDAPPELAIREAYHGLLSYFELKSEHRSTVIVFEDLQWSDQASLELLTTMYSALPDVPVLVICLTTPEFLTTNPDWEQNFNNHTLIRLGALRDDELKLLSQEILAKVESLPSHVPDQLVKHAQGNPLYLEEAIKLLVRRGFIAQSLLDDRWHLNIVEFDAVVFPKALDELIKMQFENFGERSISALERAAVIGPVFWQNWLSEMARDKKGDDDTFVEEDIQHPLNLLVRRGVITAKLFSQMDGDREFRFRHPLIQQVVRESLLTKQNSKRYHQFVYNWFESSRADRRREYLGILAHHSEAASRYKVAFDLWLEIAETAKTLTAYADAERFLKRAMNLLSSNRIKTNSAGKLEKKFALYDKLEELYRLQGLYDQQRDTLHTMRKIAERSERDDFLTRVAALEAELSAPDEV